MLEVEFQLFCFDAARLLFREIMKGLLDGLPLLLNLLKHSLLDVLLLDQGRSNYVVELA